MTNVYLFGCCGVMSTTRATRGLHLFVLSMCMYVLMPSFIRIFVLVLFLIFSSKIKNNKKENVCFLVPYLYFDYINRNA
jgi:hypothetical protein